MRKRPFVAAIVCAVLVLLVAVPALSAPSARILRIDPFASLVTGQPVLTLVVDLVQANRISSITGDCGGNRSCEAERLEKPKALFQPFPFPEKNAALLVSVDGSDYPATFVSKKRWGESLQQPGVGTAWLILVDSGGTMATRSADAKAIASGFVNAMSANDIVNVMGFGSSIVADSKWHSSAKKGETIAFINGLANYGNWGRTRPLGNIIKQGITDSFSELGNVGSDAKTPLHQAVVVISDGAAGTDPMSTNAAGLQLATYLSKGRFPEDNSALPKMPMPLISIWFPRNQYEELAQNAEEFMRNIANPEIGGFFTNVQTGGADRAQSIVTAVRDRFNHMWVLEYAVSCIAPTALQSFGLIFQNIQPPIGGDATFKDVPVGIDPTTWPLSINVQYTVDQLKKKPVRPGELFKVFGNFCWGGDKSRAEVYFVPKNEAAPPSAQGVDVDTARRYQQQLIAQGMRGTTIDVADGYAEFRAPNDNKIMIGSGDKAISRIVVVDNKAHRASPTDAQNILTVKAGNAPLPWLWIGVGGGAFVFLLVIIVAVKIAAGGKPKRGMNVPTPAPIIAGYPPPAPQPYPQQPYGVAPAGPPMGQQYSAPVAPMAVPIATPHMDFVDNTRQAYGLTGAQPMHQQPPPNPYGSGSSGGSRLVLSGVSGTFAIPVGVEIFIGRDPSKCQALLQEPRVSGVHASVRFDGTQVYVRDMGSNNGTLVNGSRIASNSEIAAPVGSMLRLGPLEFVLKYE